jgi:two-component system response regulator
MKPECSNILLVEDEEAHAELTKRAIRKSGNANRVDVACDGEEALDYLFNRGKYTDKAEYPSPCLILLDINLPGIDGIEVLKQVKNHPLLKRIPIIMLTTSEQERDIARCYDHHANSYLTKPVGYKEFEERIWEIRAYWVLINKPPVLEG